MAGSLSSINIKFAVDLKQFSKEMQNSMRTIKKQGESFKNIGSSLSTFVTLPLLAAGGASLKFASDYEESLNKVDVAFKSSSESVKSFAKDTLSAFGIAEGSALEMASLFGDMSVSMGLSESEAAKMSTSLVGLAGDLASFKNIGIDQASNALKSIFTGETESLKNLGIVMTEANLQQFALSQGYKGSIKNLTEASKVQLRYNYVLEKTKNAQGDFERTGGGAANQTRIFTESLKQIGQQIGSIILPYFTKVITLVNEKVKAFSNLSEGTKKVIVVIGGVIAVLGPLAFGIGTILTLIPNMVAGFAAVKTAFTAFTATIAANPIGAIAVAIGLVVGALIAFSGQTKKAVEEQSLLNKVNTEAVDLYAAQKVKVDDLFKSAQNENLSKKERLAAIKELNKISPQYFGNLSLETINTDKAREAQEKYTTALLNGAKAKAAQNILTQLTEERIKAEIQLAKAEENKVKNAEDFKKKLGDNVALQKGYNKELEAGNLLQRLQKKTSDDKFNSESQFLTDIIKKNKQYLDLLDQDIAGAGAGAGAYEDFAKSKDKVYKAGTIAFYENEISKLKALQSEATLTRREYLLLGQQIDGFQSKIDAITAPIVSAQSLGVTATPIDNSKYIEQLKKDNETIKLIGQEAYENDYEIKNSLLENGRLFQEGIASIMEQTVESFAVGFGQLIGQLASGGVSMQNIYTFLMTNIAGLMEQLGKAAIQIGITMSAIKSSFSSPLAAIASGIALIALSTIVKSFIPSEFNTPGFADGGIVGGNSYHGDKILARLNSGELILNQKQQSGLFGMLNEGGSNVNIGLDGAFKLSGSDLELVIERAINRNSRKR